MIKRSSDAIALLNVRSRACLRSGVRNKTVSLDAKYCESDKHNNISSSKFNGLNIRMLFIKQKHH